MIPPARHPDMDRPASSGRATRSAPVVSDDALLQRTRRLVLGAGGLAGLLAVTLVFAWPRAAAYPSLVDENLALKRRLQEVDDRMGEVDRILERLRLYDAQLRSLSEATGDHGPLPPVEAMSNSSVLEYYQDLEAEARENTVGLVTSDDVIPPGAPLPPDALRPADAWAADVADRVDDFVELFEMSEAELTALMADLETLRAIHQALPSVWPAEGVLTSGFGWRRDPLRRNTKFHSGIDIANGYGTALYAVADGTVVESRYSSGYGNVIEIDHGFGIVTKYAHCSRRRVREGDRVERGDYIGTMGSTGRSTGPHLHFELRIDGSAHDPLKYLPR